MQKNKVTGERVQCIRRIITCFMAVLLIVGAMPVAAAASLNLAQNGSFEIESGGAPSSWTLSGGSAGKEFTLVEEAADGKKAIKLHSEAGKSIFIANYIRGIIPGETYTITGKVRLLGSSTGFGTKAECVDANGNYCYEKDYKFPELRRASRWQEFSFKVVTPPEASYFILLLRSLDGGEIHFDDIRVEGRVEPAVQTCTFVDPLPDADNLVENGDFETVENGGAAGWTPHGRVWDGLATLVEEEERGNVLRLFDYENKNPWGMQLIKDLQEGASYQVTADIKSISVSNAVRFKVEFYSNNTHSADTSVTQADMPKFVPTKGEWQKVGFTFKMPVGANCICLYARMYGAGEVYYDNIEMKMIESAPYIHVGSDAFVYSEWETAEAYGDFNDVVYKQEEGSKIAFTLLDGETVLDRAAAQSTDYATYVFDTALLSEKQKEYTIRVDYIGSDGRVIASYDEPIYKYDRPARLTEDGRFITPKGEKILMSIGYHASSDHFADAAEVGINAIQVNATGSIENTRKMLDKLQEAGIYGFLELYGGMKASGHPDNAARTIEVVNTFKDHPAVMGYMTMDEPFLNDPNCYEHLRASYKLFRDLDPDKPVYIVECERQWLYKTVTVCDIFGIDPYPTGAKPNETHVSDFSRTADLVNVHDKPIMNILQSYKLGGWEPKPQDMRHMAYQAFFANNHSIGYYPLSDDFGIFDDNGKTKKGFLYEGVKYFMQEEYEDALHAFVTEEYPTFSELSNDKHPVWHKAYIKEGTLYIVLINRTEEEQTVHIPLTSGGISIGAFTAVGEDLLEREEIKGEGTFTVTLAPSDVVRYKLQTEQMLDAALLRASAFADTANYAWAEDAIGRMSALGITNVTSGEFKPGVNITRGDFAMFLVRALGLSAEWTENFADVDASSVYAKEIGIGRALGILKGTDGVHFNPESEISRQELMTITARGMELKGLGSLAVFSDADKIAEWAKESVSAMVENEIIEGNADGTINPEGSATRAEAAVIMARIVDRIEAAEVKRSNYAVPWLN